LVLDEKIFLVAFYQHNSNGLVKKYVVTAEKRKIVVMLGELCTEISNRLGTFVE
jgi:hypothetical protein